MARITTPLQDSEIKATKNAIGPKIMYDGNGLLLDVRPLPSKKKIWRFKYPHPITGKDQKLVIGEYPLIKLADARLKREEYRGMLANGLDPKEQRELARIKSENARSLEKVAREWHAEVTAKELWSADTANKALRKLEIHLFPLLGKMPIEQIETRQLKQAITAIDKKGVNRVAIDIRAYLVRIFTFAIGEGYIDRNPARELEGIVIAKKQKHYPQLKHEQLPDFFQRIADYKYGAPLTKLCTLLTLHVFIRSSEIRFARWAEIDFERQEWIIPAKRDAVDGVRYSDRGAKMKEEHFVPLSPQAISILKEVKIYSGHSENVFPGRDDPKKFISENTVNTALRRMGYDTENDVCGHGFRGMACSALIQSTLFTEDAVERQMSHKERNEVRGAYTHMAEFLDERRRMMSWWSDYLDQNNQGFISPYDFGKTYL